MKSTATTTNATATAAQYNNLRKDAYGGSMLLAHEQTSPGLTLYVEPGSCFVGTIKVIFVGGNSPSFSAPAASNKRIDLLTIDSAGTLAITQGTATTGTPAVPDYPADKLVIAEVYCRAAMTSVKDVDDAANGYIYNDVRPILRTFNGVNYIASAGSANAYTLALNPSIASYATGAVFYFKANFLNTGAATLNINGLGAKTIKKNYSFDLAGGDIQNGQLVLVQYDGTNMQMLSQIGTDLLEAQKYDVDSYTFGETIAINDSLYLKASDSKVYKTDADFADERVEFLGFAKEAGNANDVKKVQTSGKVTGFTGLTTGAIYYLSGTTGAITITPGTYMTRVGKAISTTEIFIDRIQSFWTTVPSENLRNSDDGGKGTGVTSYTKVKEVKINFNTYGTIRIKFHLYCQASGGQGKVYKNGVGLGGEVTISGSPDVDSNSDLGPFLKDDLIQVYAKTSGAYAATITNFRFYYDREPVSTAFTNQDP